MSQEAYSKFTPELKENGVLIVEEDLVHMGDVKPGVRVYSVPATRLAEELGKRMVLNIVMVGFFAAVTGLVDAAALRKAVADSVPAHFADLNLKAFNKGFDYGTAKVRAMVEAGEVEEPAIPFAE
jgi:2-oxoglutarate ferredoxin oxidoreductase subunit gamma